MPRLVEIDDTKRLELVKRLRVLLQYETDSSRYRIFIDSIEFLESLKPVNQEMDVNNGR